MKTVRRLPLQAHRDPRGSVMELFRGSWPEPGEPAPQQWNLLQSQANVLRGVHVHASHADWLVVLQGSLHLGLCDLRAESAQYLQGQLLTLRADEPALVMIPPGVAHGFYFDGPAMAVYGLSEPWSSQIDDLGCRWDDPLLGIAWPASCVAPVLSARDRDAASLTALLAQLAARMGQPKAQGQA